MSSTRQNSPRSAGLDDSTREQIRSKGLSAWAHEQRMEALKARLRAEILAEKKLSEQDIAAMPSEKRASIEDEIQKIIEERLKEAMQKAVEEAAETGKTTAVLVDIAV